MAISWTHDTVNHYIEAVGSTCGYEKYTVNKDVLYADPRIVTTMRLVTGVTTNDLMGVFFGKVDSSHVWGVVLSPTNDTIRLFHHDGGSWAGLGTILMTISKPLAWDTDYKVGVEVSRSTDRIIISIDDTIVGTYPDSPAADGEVGFMVYTPVVPGTDVTARFKNISVEESENIPPVKVIANNEYVNVIAANNAAKTELIAQRIPTDFILDIEPTLFESGAVDIGKMVTITEPEECAGTFRVQEIVSTDETCTLTIGRQKETFVSGTQKTAQRVSAARAYTTGATIAQALPMFDSPIYNDGVNNITYAYLTFRIPANMIMVNLCDLFWYLDYMTVDEKWVAETHGTAYGTGVAVDISVNGSAFAAITDSPFTGDQARVSILDALEYSTGDKIVRLRFSLSAAGEARIYGGGDLQGLVVVE